MPSLFETPFLVVDIETTGLSDDTDRIIEVACVLVLGDQPPKRVYETLVNPGRAIPNSAFHGITDAMVADAPTFAEAMSGLAAVMANRVLVAHNAQFERRHLEAAWGRHGQLLHAPWLCTMRLPRVVDLGPGDLPLWYACLRQGISLAEQRVHRAAEDAMATARLLQRYVTAMAAKGVTRLDALAGRFDFHRAEDAAERLLYRPLYPPEMLIAPTNAPQKRRAPPPTKASKPIQRYLEATVEVLEDLLVEDHEIARLDALRAELDISPAAAERVYAKVWSVAMARFEEDGVIDDVEARHIAALRVGFDRLGWSPPG